MDAERREPVSTFNVNYRIYHLSWQAHFAWLYQPNDARGPTGARRGSVGNREGKRDLARKQLRSLFGRPIAGQLVGDHDAGRPHLLFQQLAQEPLGNLLVASALDQNVEHDAGLVYGSPQPMLHPGDLEYE